MQSEELKILINNVGEGSGIYQFIGQNNEILYIGKAKNLKNRLQNYLQINKLVNRIASMVLMAVNVEIINTSNENEALLLEHNLIKKFSPRFNILLKDNKTFPYIFITSHQFPQLVKYRGSKTLKGRYFGPFASAGEVNQTIDLLRKIFQIRNCSDKELTRRKKPCLEYQIKRCTAPCVSKIDSTDYCQQINNAIAVLEGKSNLVQQKMHQEMLLFSEQQQFEKAAKIRDQLQLLTKIQVKQNFNRQNIGDADLITVNSQQNFICILVNFYRDGNNFGAKPYFYRQDIDYQDKKSHLAKILWQFLGQFYLDNIPPPILISSILPIDKDFYDDLKTGHSFLNSDIENHKKRLFEDFIFNLTQKKVKLHLGSKGLKKKLIIEAENLVMVYLKQKIAENFKITQHLTRIKEICNLTKTPDIIEVLDNSHISGTNQVGVLISSGSNGFIKNRYRKFIVDNFDNLAKYHNIAKAVAGSDLAILAEVLIRRFSTKNSLTIGLPDFLLIDGGKMQLETAKNIIKTFDLDLPIASIAKGEKRNAGEETIYYFNDQQQIISYQLEKYDPFAYYLQNIRDEAHRFAINFHRSRRDKTIRKSALDEIEGVGAKRKQALLSYFGSVEAIRQMKIDDLIMVDGISKSLAKKILDNLK